MDAVECMTKDQEIAVWQQAWREQRERADSLFRAWLAMTIVAVLTNLLSWTAWVFYR